MDRMIIVLLFLIRVSDVFTSRYGFCLNNFYGFIETSFTFSDNHYVLRSDGIHRLKGVVIKDERISFNGVSNCIIKHEDPHGQKVRNEDLIAGLYEWDNSSKIYFPGMNNNSLCLYSVS